MVIGNDEDNTDRNANPVGVVESSDSCGKKASVWEMEFDTEEHAFEWYNKYAREVGFTTRRQWKNWDKISGIISSRRFVCYKEGFRKKDKRMDVKKPRKETRTGCLARLTVSLQANGKYKVIDFESNHNHDLANKSYTHILPSQRRIGNIQKNYLRSKREHDLKQGEAGSLLDYFHNQISESPSSFFRVQMDVEDQITNIFWADAKMILDYGLFGDVVFFDTTYRTNNKYRPFGAFVGLNNHYQQVVFGASLLYDETSESFEWLFQTFLECMSDKKPKTIFSDRDLAKAKAILVVMPETYHRFCLWHLHQNALKSLSEVFKGQETFAADFDSCIYEGEYEEEFLNAWKIMLDKYSLQDNEWLQDLFEAREKWAMVYGRKTFSGGKRSMQLNKSFNSRLRNYLKPDLDLVKFLNHFQRTIDDLRYNEVRANYDMSQKIPILKVNIPLLRHAREVYTEAIFEMFQDEFEKSLMVVINTFYQNGSDCEYKVHTYGNSRQHTVTSSSDLITCTCKNFEFVGILCSHVLKVLDDMKIKMMIPEQYIVKRWTKIARAGIGVDIHGCEGHSDPKIEMRTRYRNLCNAYVRLIGKAAESKEACDFLASYASELNAKVEEYLKVQSLSETGVPSSTFCDLSEQDVVCDRNALVSTMITQAKIGKEQYKSGLEEGQKGKKCKTVHSSTHTVPSPTTCVPTLQHEPEV